jgi:hypothetical protein
MIVLRGAISQLTRSRLGSLPIGPASNAYGGRRLARFLQTLVQTATAGGRRGSAPSRRLPARVVDSRDGMSIAGEHKRAA